jgi:hypothetical protein
LVTGSEREKFNAIAQYYVEKKIGEQFIKARLTRVCKGVHFKRHQPIA